jgi:transposase InsO family protein
LDFEGAPKFLAFKIQKPAAVARDLGIDGNVLAHWCREPEPAAESESAGKHSIEEFVRMRRELAKVKLQAVLLHSDQGSQYTSEDFQRLLASHGIVCSMSRRGSCWDNAAMYVQQCWQ